MKQLQYSLTVVVLIICVKITQAQPHTSLFHLKETPQSQGWWQVSTNPESKWKAGKIILDNEISQSPELSLFHKVGYGDDLSIMHSPSYELPQSKSLWLSLALDCQLKDASSIFRIDFWDGEVWRAVYVAHQLVKDQLWFDISQFRRTDFQMKFVYKSKGYQGEHISIHQLELHQNAPAAPQSSSLDVQISPNPFQSDLHIRATANTSETISFQITDIQGKLWKKGHIDMELGRNDITLYLEELPNGIYTISINQNGYTSHRLIQKR